MYGSLRIALRAPVKGLLLRCESPARPGEDVHQAFRAISIRFQRFTADSKSPPPAADAFAERSQTAEHGIGRVAVLLEIGASVVGDCVKPWGLRGSGHIACFRKVA